MSASTTPEPSTNRLSLQRDLALHRALDDEILVAGDLSVDDDAGTDDRVRHVVRFPFG